VITPVYDDSGTHIGFAKVTRDDTRNRAHEEERRTFLDQRVHLLAVTAHELRTPIAVIDGSAARIQDGDLSPAEGDELLGAIRRSAHRLRRLAEDLSTASRSGDALGLRWEEVALGEVAHSAAARARSVRADIPVEVELSDDSDAVFLTDADRLAQALDNLLDNAARHGVPPIGLRASVGRDVRIRVTDAGPGVPAELVPKLFERFAMAGPSAGTGIGLYLVGEMARLLGGTVTYRPPLAGAPTAFEITLPRHG